MNERKLKLSIADICTLIDVCKKVSQTYAERAFIEDSKGNFMRGKYFAEKSNELTRLIKKLRGE